MSRECGVTPSSTVQLELNSMPFQTEKVGWIVEVFIQDLVVSFKLFCSDCCVIRYPFQISYRELSVEKSFNMSAPKIATPRIDSSQLRCNKVGCNFYGTPQCEGFCSQCYREHVQHRQLVNARYMITRTTLDVDYDLKRSNEPIVITELSFSLLKPVTLHCFRLSNVRNKNKLTRKINYCILADSERTCLRLVRTVS